MKKPMPMGMYDDNVSEIMKLMDEHPELFVDENSPEAASLPSKEDLLAELVQGSQSEVLIGQEAAMAEYSMMMTQWDALVADYERREAEEAAETAAAAKADADA